MERLKTATIAILLAVIAGGAVWAATGGTPHETYEFPRGSGWGDTDCTSGLRTNRFYDTGIALDRNTLYTITFTAADSRRPAYAQYLGWDLLEILPPRDHCERFDRQGGTTWSIDAGHAILLAPGKNGNLMVVVNSGHRARDVYQNGILRVFPHEMGGG